MLDAIDRHENLIEMPLPLSMLSHVRRPLRSDLIREDRTKSIDPEAHALMLDVDATLVEQEVNIAEGNWKPVVHHHGKLDYL